MHFSKFGARKQFELALFTHSHDGTHCHAQLFVYVHNSVSLRLDTRKYGNGRLKRFFVRLACGILALQQIYVRSVRSLRIRTGAMRLLINICDAQCFGHALKHAALFVSLVALLVDYSAFCRKGVKFLARFHPFLF